MAIYFSVVIPILQPSAHLLSCLLSIEKQSFQLYEIILVDYCRSISEDMYKQISRFTRVSYESINVLGVYAAMNHGLGLATGKWVLFLGHDDYLFSHDTLGLVHDYIASCSNIPMAFYGNCLINGNPGWSSDGAIYDGSFSCAKLFSKNICQQAIFYNKETCLAVGPLDERQGITADWKFNLKLYLIGDFIYMPYIVSVFRAGGLSSSAENIKRAFSPSRSWLFVYKLHRDCGFSLVSSFIRSARVIVGLFFQGLFDFLRLS